MDKELIERLAKKAGGWIDCGDENAAFAFTDVELQNFAALVAAECVKEIEYFKRRPDGATFHGTMDGVIDLSTSAIRAKFPLPEVKP